MSSPRFAEVRARARSADGTAKKKDPACEAEDDETTEDMPDDEESEPGCKKDETMTEKSNASVPDATAIRAEERGRIKAVFASDAVKGRELAAVELLAESDMSADKIVAMLPKLQPAASAENDEIGRKMLDKMGGEEEDLGTGGQSENADAKAANAASWGKAAAFANSLNGYDS